MSEELFAQMRQSVIDGDAAAAAALAEQALADGVPPLDAIDKGFVPGLTHVGEESATIAHEPFEYQVITDEPVLSLKGDRPPRAGLLVMP